MDPPLGPAWLSPSSLDSLVAFLLLVCWLAWLSINLDLFSGQLSTVPVLPPLGCLLLGFRAICMGSELSDIRTALLDIQAQLRALTLAVGRLAAAVASEHHSPERPAPATSAGVGGGSPYRAPSVVSASSTTSQVYNHLSLCKWQTWLRPFVVDLWTQRSVLIVLGLLAIGQGLCWRVEFQSPDQALPLDCQTPSTWSSGPLTFHPLWSAQQDQITEPWLGTLIAIPCPTRSLRWQRLRSTAQVQTSLIPPRSINGDLEAKGLGFRLPRALHVGMAPGNGWFGHGGVAPYWRSPSCFAKWCHPPRRSCCRCRTRRRCPTWSPSCVQCSWLSRRWSRSTRGRPRGGGFSGGRVGRDAFSYGPLFRGRRCNPLFLRRPVLATFSRAFAGDGASVAVDAGFYQGSFLLCGRRDGPRDSSRGPRRRGGQGGRPEEPEKPAAARKSNPKPKRVTLWPSRSQQ